MNIPRPEYPRPQFVRPDWLCLNGEWEFEIDAGDSGLERGLRERTLAQYTAFCGIDYATRTIAPRAFRPPELPVWTLAAG